MIRDVERVFTQDEYGESTRMSREFIWNNNFTNYLLEALVFFNIDQEDNERLVRYLLLSPVNKSYDYDIIIKTIMDSGFTKKILEDQSITTSFYSFLL